MYRFFEILPAALAWGTFLLMGFASWKAPAAAAIFIILFDVYWLFRTIYLSFHLRATFREMRVNMRVNWRERLEEREKEKRKWESDAANVSRVPLSSSSFFSWRNIYHLIIFPMYREPYEVVRESFEHLASVNYPKDRLIVVLATEEDAGEAARDVAERITREYGSTFGKFLVTRHPRNLPGEIRGKGSNATWAAREAIRFIVDPLIEKSKGRREEGEACDKPHISLSSFYFPLSYDNFLVSVFDVDTQVFPEYFGRLTYTFLTASRPWQAVYQPIPLFTNNIFQAPALARVVAFSCTFWQMMQQARPERLTTFSSQSIPLTALLNIGFWHRDVVSEDSRIFWQGYLRYHGDFRVVPLRYPVSMDANVAPTFWGTMKNLYRQQRRWGWGVENIPYMLEGFRKDPKISSRRKWYWGFHVLEGFHSWATNSIIIFALGWLPLIVGGREFRTTLLSYSLPRITRAVMGLAMIGIASSAIISMMLLPPRPAWFRKRHYALYFLQWLLLPLTLIVFGAVPGLEAQTRLMLGGRFRLGFWATPKSRESRI